MIFEGKLWYTSKDQPQAKVCRSFNSLEDALEVYEYCMIRTNINGPDPRTKGRYDPVIKLSEQTLKEINAACLDKNIDYLSSLKESLT